jgi:hypothetical protein
VVVPRIPQKITLKRLAVDKALQNCALEACISQVVYSDWSTDLVALGLLYIFNVDAHVLQR